MEQTSLPRRNAPVFVVGSPRSGTTYFYHLLLSAGDFVIYRTEARIFDMIEPHFGGLRRRADCEAMLNAWLPSEFFRRSGLPPEAVREKVLNGCRSGGDLLRILMDAMRTAQGVRRWAECTPHNALYIDRIKRSFPDALFVHMIRDGRDVALSYARQGWAKPLPWDASARAPLVAGLFWEWLVRRGQASGRRYPADYMEVRFEDLNADPRGVLARVGKFIEHDLDYDRILKNAIGSVNDPNTSFAAELQRGRFQPVGRWKSGFSEQQLAELEALIGPTLESLGYELATPKEERRRSAKLVLDGFLYRRLFSAKHFLKEHTPLGRLTNIDLLRDFDAFDQDRLQPAPNP